jgi:hypothetical protein
MSSVENISAWRDHDVVDPGGEKVGPLRVVYYDIDSDEPLFLGVETGMLRHRLSLVPVAGAKVGQNQIQVSSAKSQVDHAPAVELGAELSRDMEPRIFAHYDLPYVPGPTRSGRRLIRH